MENQSAANQGQEIKTGRKLSKVKVRLLKAKEDVKTAEEKIVKEQEKLIKAQDNLKKAQDNLKKAEDKLIKAQKKVDQANEKNQMRRVDYLNSTEEGREYLINFRNKRNLDYHNKDHNAKAALLKYNAELRKNQKDRKARTKIYNERARNKRKQNLQEEGAKTTTEKKANVLKLGKNNESSATASHPSRIVSVIVNPLSKYVSLNSKEVSQQSQQAGSLEASKTIIVRVHDKTKDFNPRSDKGTYEEMPTQNSNNKNKMNTSSDYLATSDSVIKSVVKENNEASNLSSNNEIMTPTRRRYLAWISNKHKNANSITRQFKLPNDLSQHKTSIINLEINSGNKSSSKTIAVEEKSQNKQVNFRENIIIEEYDAFKRHLVDEQLIYNNCLAIIGNRETSSSCKYKSISETSLINPSNVFNDYTANVTTQQLVYNKSFNNIVDEQNTSNQTPLSQTAKIISSAIICENENDSGLLYS